MSPPLCKKPHGQIRQGQVVTTFGPGAMLDLPHYSVIVAGLEHWLQAGDEIHEPRLIEKLNRLLGIANLRLYMPPPDREEPAGPQTGITVWQFPEWFVTQDVDTAVAGRYMRSRLLVPRSALTKGKFIDSQRRKRPVVPVRFVRACRRGHIGDIDWYAYAHKVPTTCRRQLWLDERGTSGDLAEVWIRCECGAERIMWDATVIQARPLSTCDGARPWLGPYTKEVCGEPNRLLIRTASNAYFPQLMSVISLPDRDGGLARAVDQVWQHYLEHVESLEDLKSERKKKPPVRAALDGYTDEEVFAEIRARRTGGAAASGKSVKQAELEILMASKEELGNDQPDGNFYPRALLRSSWDQPWLGSVERVVLVHRLKEVIAQVGFTRFEAAAPDVEGELEMGVRRAALARETAWLPAVENRGEGIFLGFRKEAIDAWLGRRAVVERGQKLSAGFESWRTDHHGSARKFAGLPYILLHSLSHLLITAVALECGYPASSIRERIYAGEGGYGILLYTGSPDAEGTLGGLVEAGRRIATHVSHALELGQLCSNDPVCAQHDPVNPHVRRFLHGAACHGCLLIAETSCEQYNDFLDRALVVPTVDDTGASFFKGAV